MRKTNTVIVGQGIAGSLVAFMLHLKKIPFTVIDPGVANSASLVAAGMYSSISGKRKTIDPFLLQQIPFAVSIYQQVERLIGKKIIHQQDIYQLFDSTEEKNDLLKKTADNNFAKYISDTGKYFPGIIQDTGSLKISNAGWVDCALFITSFREWLVQNDLLLPESFIHNDLQIGTNNLVYHKLEFKNIIFCEGYRAANNPFFPGENIIPCKGDILTIGYAITGIDGIIKKNDCYCIPFTTNTIKAGSTYQWNNTNEAVTDNDKKIITKKLDTIFDNEYTIIDHQTAIRPTTKNREVIAKQHEVHLSLFMLNGLGTKGIIQGPWWADHLIKLIPAADSA